MIFQLRILNINKYLKCLDIIAVVFYLVID